VHVPSEGFLGDEAMKEKLSKRIRKVTTVSHLKQHCQTFWRQSRKKIIQNGQGLKVHLDRLLCYAFQESVEMRHLPDLLSVIPIEIDFRNSLRR